MLDDYLIQASPCKHQRPAGLFYPSTIAMVVQDQHVSPTVSYHSGSPDSVSSSLSTSTSVARTQVHPSPEQPIQVACTRCGRALDDSDIEFAYPCTRESCTEWLVYCPPCRAAYGHIYVKRKNHAAKRSLLPAPMWRVCLQTQIRAPVCKSSLNGKGKCKNADLDVEFVLRRDVLGYLKDRSKSSPPASRTNPHQLLMEFFQKVGLVFSPNWPWQLLYKFYLEAIYTLDEIMHSVLTEPIGLMAVTSFIVCTGKVLRFEYPGARLPMFHLSEVAPITGQTEARTLTLLATVEEQPAPKPTRFTLEPSKRRKTQEEEEGGGEGQPQEQLLPPPPQNGEEEDVVDDDSDATVAMLNRQ